ncbi:MAG: PQQ-binding-like beta-propeller repeat protein [Planctomycetota bacterium]
MNDTAAPTSAPPARAPRLWPLAIVLAVQAAAIVMSLTPSVPNFPRFAAMMAGPALSVLLFLVWLLGASRLPWGVRGTILGAVVLPLIALQPVMQEGANLALWIYGVPLAMLGTAIALALTRASAPRTRRACVLALGLVAWTPFPLLRIDGFVGDYSPELSWRWTPTPEERMLAAREASAPSTPIESPALTLRPGDWPAYRGAQRNGRVSTPPLALDWSQSPPTEAWRIDVGPGWSSFIHVDGRLFTQEQRGGSEAVTCYDAATGAEVWSSAYEGRFTEVVSGAGPRATPTFHDGRVYALGALAMLSACDAATGEVAWRRDLVADMGAVIPMWGASASPLVAGGQVIVYVDGTEGRGLVAFDPETGEERWHLAWNGMNYGSAQPARLAGEDLVLFTHEEGLSAVRAADGEVAWTHLPEGWKTVPMIQPQAVDEDTVLVALGDGTGIARLEIARDGDAWSIEDSWSSNRMRPSFNDFVVHEGHVYGYDQSILTCLELETGERAWRRGRYGFGQLVLLPDADALLIVAESGDLALVSTDPTAQSELGRVELLDGKTWNHPIVVGDRVYARNGETAVCSVLQGVAR